MLTGHKTYLGHGYWRDVFLVNYDGQEVVVKALRDDQRDTTRNRQRHRWEAVALDAVRYMSFCTDLRVVYYRRALGVSGSGGAHSLPIVFFFSRDRGRVCDENSTRVLCGWRYIFSVRIV